MGVPKKNGGQGCETEREDGFLRRMKEEEEDMRERERERERREKRSVDRIIYQLVFASYSSVYFQRFLRGRYNGVSPWILLLFATFCELDSKRVNPKIV